MATTGGTTAFFNGELTNLSPRADVWNLTGHDQIFTETNSFSLVGKRVVGGTDRCYQL